jgi:lipopolysaccharide/colanic/teichoic acid biosynthesis glycosyltransferase
VFKFKLSVKRLFDIISSFLALVVLSPLILLISVIVWISMGKPILFKQPRLGLHGKEFMIYKFRTMSSKKGADGNLLPDSDRLTRVGRFLRSTTLDELPELINVFLGDMSAVGPRPLLVDYKDLYTADQWRRHEMPPGMAGPVLAGGRNALSWEEKFERDLWYVDHWSLWLDFKIIVQTMIRVVKREGTSAEGYATMPKFEGTPTNKQTKD